MQKPLPDFKGYKKIINLKFLHLNIPKFKELKPPVLYPPLYVLFFGLIVSAVVLGITAYWENKLAPVAYKTDNLEAAAPQETEVIFINPPSAGERAGVSLKPPVKTENKQTPVAAPASAPVKEETKEPDLNGMLQPVQGQIGQGFAFVYSQVHEDYRLHPGVDFIAQKGSPVKAALSGKVEKVEQLSDGGYKVTLTHGAGWQTVYSALETELQQGQQVDQGTTLGRLVGETPGEPDQGSHLHFELRKSGKAVNPAEYLR